MLQQMLFGLPPGEMTPEDAASMKRAMALYGLGSVFKGDDASPTLQSMMMMDMARSKNAKEQEEQERIQSEISSIWNSPMTQTPGVSTRTTPRRANPNQTLANDTMRAIGKEPIYPTVDDVTGYIRQSASKYGIDPETAVRVAASEGLNADPREAWQSRVVKNGKRERSYGPFQLYIDGGLGNEFMETTGLDPRDPKTWKQQVDFALKKAAEGGWGPWYGAARVGIGNREGIGVQQPVRTAQNGTDWRAIAMRIRNSNLPPEEKQRQFQQLRTMMQIEQAQQPADRKTVQDATGRLRYLDSGEYVFPDVQVPEDQPTSVREYEYARQNGFQGSYNDFLSAKGKANATNVSTTVNTGDQPDARPMADKPAKGYQRRWDQERGTWVDEPIPGGEIERERQEAAQAADKLQTRKKTTATVVLDDINRIRKIVSNDTEIPLFGSTTTGMAGGLLSRVDSTQAGAVRNMLDTIRSNIGFDKLQSMREESPTGGAVGQVSNLENRLMQATFGALVQSQGKEQFMYNLERVEKIYDRIINEGISDQEAENLLVGLGGAASDPLGIR